MDWYRKKLSVMTKAEIWKEWDKVANELKNILEERKVKVEKPKRTQISGRVL